MISRRDWQLQNLGITQLALRRPNVLLGEISFFIPENIHLLVVTKKSIELNDLFVSDVFRVLQISYDQVLQLNPDCRAIFRCASHCNSWKIGVTEKIILKGITITSSSLYELKNNPTERKHLWEQICAHERDFFN